LQNLLKRWKNVEAFPGLYHALKQFIHYRFQVALRVGGDTEENLIHGLKKWSDECPSFVQKGRNLWCESTAPALQKALRTSGKNFGRSLAQKRAETINMGAE